MCDVLKALSVPTDMIISTYLFSGAVMSMFYSAVSILKYLKKFAFFSF